MLRSKSALLAFLFSLLIASCAFAQRSSRSQPTEVEIQVRVTYPNEQPAPQQLRVDLLNSSGIPVMQTLTNDMGKADFHVVGSGDFRIKVSGMGIQDAISELVQIADSDRSKQVYVQVHSTSDPDSNSKPGNGAMTSASQLRILPAAGKSFDKGVEALQQKDYKKAADFFEKATTAYPQYDAAYDNLGVAYMSLGQADKARTAFEHAVQLNDKNADADRNYSRLLISDKEYVAAKGLLQKALMVEPQDPSTLTLLAITQLKTGDYDGALQSAMKVHSASHEGYAVAHYVAGRAFENKHEPENATTEYQMYLRESPNGPEAEQVRASLARVTAHNQAQATPQ
jgi:Tfp pilus assembly protein PilF